MSSAPRKRISLKTKLASALLALGHIPYDDAKHMTAEQITSLYNFDHGILHATRIEDSFWNLTPRLITPHREKTKRDIGIVAKTRRIERHPEKWRDILAPKKQRIEKQSRWPKRKFRT